MRGSRGVTGSGDGCFARGAGAALLRRGALPEGTRLHCIHGEGDLRGVWLQRGPVGDCEDKDGDAAGGEILLVAQVLVGGDEESEAG
jgi:hypothetical protein